MKFVYPATFTELEEGGYLVTFRDFPEAITEGDDFKDATANAMDCLDEAVAGRIDDDEDLPAPSRRQADEHFIALPVESAMKAALYLSVRAQGLNKSQLAQRLGVDEKVARRLLNPHYSTKADKMQAALAALDAVVEVEYRPG